MDNYCFRDCSRCFLKEKCGGCSMCEVPLCNKECKNCGVMCSRKPEVFNHYFTIQETRPKGNSEIWLPAHIPIMPDRISVELKPEIMPVYAVHAGNMFSQNGESISKNYIRGLDKALNINKKSKAILEFYVKDRTLEGFWDNRHRIYEELKKLNLYSIIAANFSVYEDAPRIEHLYNLKRSMIVYNEILSKGMHCIPDIAWYNKIDLDKWCEVIERNNINVIAFSFQVVGTKLKASNTWKRYILGFRYMCQRIPKHVDIIVAGIISQRKVKKLFEASEGHKIHVLNQSAYIQSQRGILSEDGMSSKADKGELLIRNLMYFNQIYDLMNRR